MDISHHHWGMTSRNAKERNGGSRNDSALNALTALLDGVSVSSMFVQTCGHRDGHYSIGRGEVLQGACPLGLPDCRRETALFLGYSGELPRDAANVMARTSRLLRIPSFLVEHEPRDEVLSGGVTISRVLRSSVERTEGSWRDFTTMLREVQFSHEVKSDHPDCSSAERDWLRVGAGKGISADLSLSNAIREVPGVRHTDIDAVLSCTECGVPVVLIESSSDGITPREEAIKAATVTRAIGRHAKVTTYLIQHQVDDAELREPIALTKWVVTGSVSDRYDHEMTDWDTARRVIQTTIDDHWERFCVQPQRMGS